VAAGERIPRIVVKRKHVNLSLLETPIAAGIAVSYYLLFFMGEMLTRLSPGSMTRRFRV